MSKAGRPRKTTRPLDEATSAFLKQKYATEMGQKVLIERHKIQNSAMSALREVLSDIGKDLQTQRVVTEGIEYWGTFSVHVYYSHALNRMEFATVTSPGKTPFNVAEDATRELFGSICEDYGHKRQTRRSGAS